MKPAPHIMRPVRFDRAQAVSSNAAAPIVSMTTQVPRELWTSFDRIARKRRTTKSALIRELVEACVSKEMQNA